MDVFFLFAAGIVPVALAIRAFKNPGEAVFAVILTWAVSFGGMVLSDQLFEYDYGEIHIAPLLIGFGILGFCCFKMFQLGNEINSTSIGGFDGHESDSE